MNDFSKEELTNIRNSLGRELDVPYLSQVALFQKVDSMIQNYCDDPVTEFHQAGVKAIKRYSKALEHLADE